MLFFSVYKILKQTICGSLRLGGIERQQTSLFSCTYISGSVEKKLRMNVYGKLKKLSECLLVKLHHSNLVNTIFHLIF